MKKLSVNIILIFFFSINVLSQYKSQLFKIDSLYYQLNIIVKNKIDTITLKKRMPYRIFKFKQIDIDNNNQDEFVFGVIKKTTFDTSENKRINIWKIEDNAIVPMWLGSKMFHPLYDFEIKKDTLQNVIYTIECESDGLYLVAKYKWHSFGLKFVKFIKREIELEKAYYILNRVCL